MMQNVILYGEIAEWIHLETENGAEGILTVRHKGI